VTTRGFIWSPILEANLPNVQSRQESRNGTIMPLDDFKVHPIQARNQKTKL